MFNIKAVKSPSLSKPYSDRFVIINVDTGEILDDCQGYGYKTKQKAHIGYAYKTRDKSKDREKEARRKEIKKWLRTHKGFTNTLDEFAFEIAKGSWDEDDKVDAKLVKTILKNLKLETEFKPSEILRVWEKY
jgi:hypothetical protein